MRDDPIGHSRPRDIWPTFRGRAAGAVSSIYLMNFSSYDERAESKWESDSRNVDYGIFRITPKKRARRRRLNRALYIWRKLNLTARRVARKFECTSLIPLHKRNVQTTLAISSLCARGQDQHKRVGRANVGGNGFTPGRTAP